MVKLQGNPEGMVQQGEGRRQMYEEKNRRLREKAEQRELYKLQAEEQP